MPTLLYDNVKPSKLILKLVDKCNKLNYDKRRTLPSYKKRGIDNLELRVKIVAKRQEYFKRLQALLKPAGIRINWDTNGRIKALSSKAKFRIKNKELYKADGIKT